MSYFKESNGQNSSVRLIFVIGMIWSMLISTVVLFATKCTALEFVTVFTATSGVFIALKLGQKPMEVKTKDEQKNNFADKK